MKVIAASFEEEEVAKIKDFADHFTKHTPLSLSAAIRMLVLEAIDARTALE